MKDDTRGILALGELTDNFDAIRVPIKEVDRKEGVYPYYGASGIIDMIDDYLLDGEYLLIAEDGENLRSRKTPIAFMASGKFWVNNHAHIVRGNEKADSRYLMYYLLQADISGFLTGSTLPKLTQNNLNRIPIYIPSLPEQRAIAGVLGALDDKIELNRRMNRTLEAMARAVFREWFVDNEEVREWEVGRLGDFIEINRQSITKDYPHNEIEYIDISSVTVGHLEATNYFDLKDAPSRAKRLVQHGDTIWSTVRPNRKSYLFISNPKENLVVSTGFAVLTPVRVPPSFLYFYTTTDLFVDYLVSNADGSAYPAVLPERFNEAEFPIPPKNRLLEFDCVAGPLLAKIASNEKESRTLASMRDALLPKLMRGEVRVAVHE